MRLTREELEMLDGKHGEAPRRAMDALVQLGTAYGAEDMVPIGYAHVHSGMALYARDVELLEDLVRMGANVSVPTSANVTNVDTDNWRVTGAPEKLARVHLHIELPSPAMRVMVVDSAKQARYVRDMIGCDTLLTSAEGAVASAVSGRFVPRRGA